MLKNLTFWTIVAAGGLTTLKGGTPDSGRINAQKVVTELKAAHPEITSLELAATKSQQDGCKTIAATEANEIGQKCDKDELTAIKSDSLFVEQELCPGIWANEDCAFAHSLFRSKPLPRIEHIRAFAARRFISASINSTLRFCTCRTPLAILDQLNLRRFSMVSRGVMR